MEGWWGYNDRFRILPVPVDAPRPHFSMGAYPFLLEFTYNQSLEFTVSGRRRQREGHRLGLILSSLVRRSITWHLPIAFGNRNFAWVRRDETPLEPVRDYARINYEPQSTPSILYP